MTKRRLIFITGLILCVVMTAVLGIWIYYVNTRVLSIRQIDYFHGAHTVLGSGAMLYDMNIKGIEAVDIAKHRTIYNVILKDGNIEISAEMEYPGTPKAQYYRFPVLRKNKRYILIAGLDIHSTGAIREKQYYLFQIQEIDGEEYAYPIIIDTSVISLELVGEKISFKYQQEAEIYDRHQDRQEWILIERYGWKVPVFSYKLRLSDLRMKYRNLLRM